MTQTILTQYVTPLVICVAWYLLSGALGSILGRWTSIETWVIANPKRALAYQILRRMGLDFKGLIASFQAFAAARSKFPPIVHTEATVELVPDVGAVKTEIIKRVTVDASAGAK
jgi:hypothetical protein